MRSGEKSLRSKGGTPNLRSLSCGSSGSKDRRSVSGASRHTPDVCPLCFSVLDPLRSPPQTRPFSLLSRTPTTDRPLLDPGSTPEDPGPRLDWVRLSVCYSYRTPNTVLCLSCPISSSGLLHTEWVDPLKPLSSLSISQDLI